MLLELVLFFSCYFSVIRIAFLNPHMNIAHSGESKDKATCLVLGVDKRKIWGYLPCIPVRVHSTLVKGKPTSCRLLLCRVPLHHRNETINDAFHTGIACSFTSICKSQISIWKLFFQGPKHGIHSGISAMVSGRTQISPSQKFRSAQYQLQYMFIQEVRIHPLSKSGFRSLGTPDKTPH